jgi:hypothetical protein
MDDLEIMFAVLLLIGITAHFFLPEEIFTRDVRLVLGGQLLLVFLMLLMRNMGILPPYPGTQGHHPHPDVLAVMGLLPASGSGNAPVGTAVASSSSESQPVSSGPHATGGSSGAFTGPLASSLPLGIPNLTGEELVPPSPSENQPLASQSMFSAGSTDQPSQTSHPLAAPAPSDISATPNISTHPINSSQPHVGDALVAAPSSGSSGLPHTTEGLAAAEPPEDLPHTGEPVATGAPSGNATPDSELVDASAQSGPVNPHHNTVPIVSQPSTSLQLPTTSTSDDPPNSSEPLLTPTPAVTPPETTTTLSTISPSGVVPDAAEALPATAISDGTRTTDVPATVAPADQPPLWLGLIVNLAIAAVFIGIAVRPGRSK